MSELKRTDLSVRQEHAVLVKVIHELSDVDRIDPLAELRALATAAGAIVVDVMTQRLNRPVNRTYIGRGKVEELAERTAASGANLVVFDNDLSPAQIRELEKTINCKILDRSELILDIFAARARTHEARLQVELAQLQYTAPRLRGMWTHLERIAGAGGATGAGNVGGIGTRGPGEQQIEIDRRIVRRRIAALRREIEQIDERKRRTVQARGDRYKISLVGYTNSGKTTLLNALTDAGQLAADKLFATLDTKTARWQLDAHHMVLLSDTVGFIRDLPHRLVASFRATLEEVVHADLLLHVIDASSPHALQQANAVNEVLTGLGASQVPSLGVLNKIDKADDEATLSILEMRVPNTIRISARTGMGIDQLHRAVRNLALPNNLRITLRFAASDGKLYSLIDRRAEVFDRRFENDFVELDVAIDRIHLEQIRSQHPALEVIETNCQSAGDSIP